MAEPSVETPSGQHGAVSQAVRDFHNQQLGWAVQEARAQVPDGHPQRYEQRAEVILHHLQQVHRELTELIRQDYQGIRHPERVLGHEHAQARVAHGDEDERQRRHE
jgi:hypothetical protein